MNTNTPPFKELPREDHPNSETGFWQVTVTCHVGRGGRTVPDHTVLAASLNNAFDYRDTVYKEIWEREHKWSCSVYYLNSVWVNSGTYDPLNTHISTDTMGCGEGETTYIIITPVNEVV
jgi:hypothetical protein